MKITPNIKSLETVFAKDVDLENPWSEHPRPQKERDTWKSLNGKWEFEFSTDENVPERKLKNEIVVPFAWESRLSGIESHDEKETAFYRRKFTVPAEFENKNVILHFDAVDYEATVFINGTKVCYHKGGYDSFECDITKYLKQEEQEVVVKVYDPTRAGGGATGKQDVRRWCDPRGCMYIPSSGIWQSVWLEGVSETHIDDFKITTNIEKSTMTIDTKVSIPEGLRNPHIQVLVYKDGSIIAGVQGKPNQTFDLQLENIELWSPENPSIYDVKLLLMVTTKEVYDEIKTYVAFRKISLVKENDFHKIALNDKVIFQMGPLDQGYWPEGIYTPPTDEAQKWDIEEMKRLGFNMIRKHAKVENFRWYYWCDKLGMLVWQDMPSSFGTGSKDENSDADNSDKAKADKEIKNSWRAQLKTELKALINTHINIPSIIIWAVFNEGWGEFDTVNMTEYARSLDDTRLFIPNSGYNCSTDIEAGDIKDVHNYLPPLAPTPSDKRAIVCGEYGSLGFVIKDHMYNEEGPYHGMVCSNINDASETYLEFCNNIKKMITENGLCAAVYTQWTDIENEINGIYSYDRKAIKIYEDTLIQTNKMLTE